MSDVKIPDVIELPQSINEALTLAGDEMSNYGYTVGADHSRAAQQRHMKITSEAGHALRWAIAQELKRLQDRIAELEQDRTATKLQARWNADTQLGEG